MSDTLGIGLRSIHYDDWLAGQVDLPAVEAVTENYTYSKGWPREKLIEISRHYQTHLHGVSLNIAGEDPLDIELLNETRILAEQVRAPLVSDHLCMTGMSGKTTFDLLPFPFTNEMADHIADRIKQAQDTLGCELVLENISTYLRYELDQMSEVDFIHALQNRVSFGLLLDINNLYVNSRNHGFDAREFLRQVDPGCVKAYHLGGHDDMGEFLFDTHAQDTIAPVKELFLFAKETIGMRPTFLERDGNIPSIHHLVNEVKDIVGALR